MYYFLCLLFINVYQITSFRALNSAEQSVYMKKYIMDDMKKDYDRSILLNSRVLENTTLEYSLCYEKEEICDNILVRYKFVYRMNYFWNKDRHDDYIIQCKVKYISVKCNYLIWFINNDKKVDEILLHSPVLGDSKSLYGINAIYLDSIRVLTILSSMNFQTLNLFTHNNFNNFNILNSTNGLKINELESTTSLIELRTNVLNLNNRLYNLLKYKIYELE